MCEVVLSSSPGIRDYFIIKAAEKLDAAAHLGNWFLGVKKLSLYLQ